MSWILILTMWSTSDGSVNVEHIDVFKSKEACISMAND